MRFRQHGLRHHEGAGRCEWQRGGAVDLPDQRCTVGQFGEQRVKPRIQRDIGRERIHRDRVACDQLVQLGEALLERFEIARGYPALGGEPGGEPLKYAAQFDGVEDVALAECLHHEAAGRNGFEQAFFLEPDQRHAHRRARDAGGLDRLQFRDSFARPQPARKDQVAQRQLGAHRLGHGAIGVAFAHRLTPPPAAWRTNPRARPCDRSCAAPTSRRRRC